MLRSIYAHGDLREWFIYIEYRLIRVETIFFAKKNWILFSKYKPEVRIM